MRTRSSSARLPLGNGDALRGNVHYEFVLQVGRKDSAAPKRIGNAIQDIKDERQKRIVIQLGIFAWWTTFAK